MTKRERKYHNRYYKSFGFRFDTWLSKIKVTVIPAPDKMPELEKSITIYQQIKN